MMKIGELNYSMVQESVYPQGGKGMLLASSAECKLLLLCLMTKCGEKGICQIKS